MERYVCIHGHFYQPPRENPSLEAVEVQDSAYPYHDWNERITAECYGPNGASRILDGHGQIIKIANNYARMSFNFGPTLLAWMEHQAPNTYRAVLEADQESSRIFSGHGSAMAQAYNHMILPLANARDRRTQVLWGIRDFEHRFGRFPEGMWLPETAVNLETLDVLSELGIRFTILAQHQAARVRGIGEPTWHDVNGARIDPTRAYQTRLPSGRSISLFFYDGPISRAVAFEGLLGRGERLADRLTGAFSDSRSWPQLVHIATDGESYGHHHSHGDMALAYALHHIESNDLAHLTNYAEFLEKHPPTHEVEIIENTSWSCAHGIERWRSDCGCNSGGRPDWNQAWRGPLREALDWLRDNLSSRFVSQGRHLLKDPWAARDDYVSVVLDRSRGNVQRFMSQHARGELTEKQKIQALKLLEIQRNALLMYTSCGWFFDDLSGIETVQVIKYAGRALQLDRELFGDAVELGFVELLERAPSNIPEYRDGRHIYEEWVKSSLVSLEQVGAHYAMSSLFENYGERTRVHCYTVDREDYRLLPSSKVKLALGRVKISSDITHECKRVSFGVLHLGDHNVSGGVQELVSEEAHAATVQEVEKAFARADLTEIIRAVDRSFGSNSYSLKLLLRDEQRKILSAIMSSTLGNAEAVYRQMYEHQAPMMSLLTELGVPLPKAWNVAAELAVNAGLRRAFENEDPDLERAAQLLAEAEKWQLTLDGAGLGYTLRQTLEQMIERLRANPGDLPLLQKIEATVDMARSLPFEVHLWQVQNGYYEMLQTVPDLLKQTDPQDGENAHVWLNHFAALGEKLGVRVTEMKENRIRQADMVAAAVREAAAGRRVPCATYRLQFNRDLTFQDARDLVPYLHDLGISDGYASPLFKPRSNSSHGYDICDHSQFNPAVGSMEEFESFSAELRARDMGLLLDVVPNHMGIGDCSNVWWMDVLENGPSSSFASYFDIDWRPVKPELQNKVLLPILGDQYGKVLGSGAFRLTYEDGAFLVHYYDVRLPVAPRTYRNILAHQLPTLVQALGESHEHVREMQSILTALSYLPLQTEQDAEKIAERNREKEHIKRRIANLHQSSAYVRAAVDMALQAFNGTPGDPRSFDLLHDLLDAQAYRPAFWRVAVEEINYRRFFDINELAAIRVELPQVFDSTHVLVLRLLAEGKVTGLRIDHPDGLRSPHDYFRLLQESFLVHRARAHLGSEGSQLDLSQAISRWFAEQSSRAEVSPVSPPLYVVAEKILCQEESLPCDWMLDGTTGYDFLNAVNDICVDGSNRAAFDRVYSRFIGSEIAFPNLTNSTKKMIMLVSLVGEINALGHQLERVAEKNRLYRDFTLNSLVFAIREVIAALPVYRTYISGPDSVGEQDEIQIEAAVAEAKKRNPRTAAPIFDFIQETLLLRNVEDFAEEDRGALVDLVMKFQQVTGPVTAKGVEDTAFYIYNRLISLNEVGGHPERFGSSVTAFHQENTRRQQGWPHSLLATSTHDTKRSEDVRARLNVLSEIPKEWGAALTRWARFNTSRKTVVDDEPAPDRNDEYLLYQTLLGSWPDGPLPSEAFAGYRERIVAYMQKATKEAKVHTSWVNPNEKYDRAVQEFVRRVLSDGDDPFISDLLVLQRRIAYHGRFNALSQTLLKLTAPGVPDIYQGTELWDYSLVDPDNRRPVDYQLRRSLLDELRDRVARDEKGLAVLARELLDTAVDGRIKLYLIHRTLSFRRAHRQLFATGSYLPLQARGVRQDHVCAFARVLGQEEVLVIVPRLTLGLVDGLERPPLGPDVWNDTRLTLLPEHAGQTYRNVLTGELLSSRANEGEWSVPLAEVCAHFPVALLELQPK